MSASPDRDALTDYWRRLGSLNDAEWKDLHRLVRSALMRCPASELSSLPDKRENYIDEFFVEKLFYKAQRVDNAAGESLSGGALCLFFRNYLRQLLDHYKARPISGDEPEESWDSADPADSSDVDEFLASFGIDRLAGCIEAFLDQLPDWALLMLRGHFCADEPVPMYTLCAGIPSYQYKAQKLGVTVKKGDAGLLGYEHSMIGQWIQSLGVPIRPDNQIVIQFLMEAICREATLRVEDNTP